MTCNCRLIFFSISTLYSFILINLCKSTVSSYITDSSAPYFNKTTINYTAPVGEMATLKCCIVNLGTKTVTWRRKDQFYPLTINNVVYVGDPRISVVHKSISAEVDEWNLVIRSLKMDDTNSYECQISTKPMMIRDFHLKVLDIKKPPQMVVKVTGAQYVENGTTLSLLCQATGRENAPLDVLWLKNGEILNSNVKTGILITKRIQGKSLISVFSLYKGLYKDSGDYECRVDDQNKAKLTVTVIKGTARLPVRLQENNASKYSLSCFLFLFMHLSLILTFL